MGDSQTTDWDCFNPRSRTGSDLGVRSHCKTGCQVSIHAPARGATLLTCLASALLPWFQSTLPHGERLSVALWLSLPGSFNPRSRTGSDLFSVPFHFIQSMFQSTLPHGERRRYEWRHCLWQRVSIHAPARGATLSQVEERFTIFVVSIHAPARGATHTIGFPSHRATKFQSTLPHGERRRQGLADLVGCGHFNPRSRTGSDFTAKSSMVTCSPISIHAPARGATGSGRAV